MDYRLSTYFPIRHAEMNFSNQIFLYAGFCLKHVKGHLQILKSTGELRPLWIVGGDPAHVKAGF